MMSVCKYLCVAGVAEIVACVDMFGLLVNRARAQEADAADEVQHVDAVVLLEGTKTLSEESWALVLVDVCRFQHTLRLIELRVR